MSLRGLQRYSKVLMCLSISVYYYVRKRRDQGNFMRMYILFKDNYIFSRNFRSTCK